jgi:hypothetical protein
MVAFIWSRLQNDLETGVRLPLQALSLRTRLIVLLEDFELSQKISSWAGQIFAFDVECTARPANRIRWLHRHPHAPPVRRPLNRTLIRRHSASEGRVMSDPN